jgi:hypothetical protein
MKSSWFSWPVQSELPPLPPSEIIIAEWIRSLKSISKTGESPSRCCATGTFLCTGAARRVGPLLCRRWCDGATE